MPLSFPLNPTIGQQYTAGGTTWQWDGSAWNILPEQDPEFNTVTAVTFYGSASGLTDIPTPDLTGYATETYVDDAVAGVTVDLTGYATETYVDDAIAAIPAVDLTGLATETYVNNAVSNLVDTAPGTLDTLNELAAALGDDPNFATTVSSALGLKANSADLATVATSGAYSDLSGRPTLATVATSGAYADLSGRPTLATVATSGAYSDLSGTPSIPASINDLSDVDTVSTTPNTGDVLKWNGTNWAPGIDATTGGTGTDADTLDGFDSSYFLNYLNLSNKPTLATVATSGSFTDLSNVPAFLLSESDTLNTVTGRGATTTNGITVGSLNTHTIPAGTGTLALTSDLSTFTTLASFSVGAENPAAGDGGIAYNNTSGVFTYTPPDLTAYLTAEADTLSSVTGRGATTATAISLTANTGSTSTTSGTLIVTGGVGISQNLNVGGALTVTGNLTVNGTTTTVNSTTITVDDINIELGSVASPTDTTANGGGITLRGATNKTINWVQSTGRWTSNQPFEATSIQNTAIGSSTAASGAFTTLSASSTVGLSPASASVTISPTGTGTVTLNPATAGTINNMSIGATTKASGGFTSLTATGAVTLTQNTGSTSTTSGTLVVTGGVGISQNLYAGGNAVISGGATVNTLAIGSTGYGLDSAGNADVLALTVADTTETTAADTGALQVSGGAWIAKNLLIGGDFSLAGIMTTRGTQETMPTLTNASGTVTHDFAEAAVWWHTTPTSNFQADFTNMPETDGFSTVVTLVIEQPVSGGYIADNVLINSVGVPTILWLGGSAPTPTASTISVLSFVLVRQNSNWTVLGSLQSYG